MTSILLIVLANVATLVYPDRCDRRGTLWIYN